MIKKGFKINLSIQPGLVEPEPRRFDITPSSGGDYAI